MPSEVSPRRFPPPYAGRVRFEATAVIGCVSSKTARSRMTLNRPEELVLHCITSLSPGRLECCLPHQPPVAKRAGHGGGQSHCFRFEDWTKLSPHILGMCRFFWEIDHRRI